MKRAEAPTEKILQQAERCHKLFSPIKDHPVWQKAVRAAPVTGKLAVGGQAKIDSPEVKLILAI